MNKFREKPEENTEQQQQRPKRRKWFARALQSVFSGSFLEKENAIRQLPFLFLLVSIAIFNIANGYYTTKTVRQINKFTNDLKELRSEYVIVKSELMMMSEQSRLAKRTAALGIKESVVPPKKIAEGNINTNAEPGK